MSALQVRLQVRTEGSGSICRHVLANLPGWFGIPESVDDFVAVSDRSPTVVAFLEDASVGLLTIVRHSQYAAEVYVMGVLPQFHRSGIGSQLLQRAERTLVSLGVEFLQVKTVSPSKHDAGYERTRAFYQAMGFRPLEEFRDLWGPDNPALQMVKALPHNLDSQTAG